MALLTDEEALYGLLPNREGMTHYRGQSGLQRGLLDDAANYGQRVVTGQVAMQGLNNLDSLMQRAMSGDQQAALELGMNFMPGAIGAIKAFHGSPHKFDKFSLDKIGTGEGAQAYGHGLYFAESPEVAKSYSADRSYVGKFMDGNPDNTPWDAARIAKSAVDVHGDNAEAFLSKVLKANSASKNPGQIASNQQVADALALVKSGEAQRTGNLYTVNLKPNPEDLLDWDKPLSQQSEKVKAALAQKVQRMMQEENPIYRPMESWLKQYNEGTLAGEQVYRALGNGTDAGASEAWRRVGIPGIKYLDGGSRSAGQGSSNFVIFDDQLVDILERQ